MASPSLSPLMTGVPPMNPQSMMMGTVPSNLPPGTPPGLAYLLGVNSLLIRRQREAGCFIGINSNKRFDIFDCWGRRIYLAEGVRNCGVWNITIFDGFGQPVMLGQRGSGCCTSGSMEAIQVSTPQGDMLGTVIPSREFHCGSASWDITDGKGVGILRLEAPCCSTKEFPLRAGTGEQVGVISKEFGSLLREMFTRADTFIARFPPDLDITVKATLIFATFMIDIMYDEEAAAA